MCIDTLTRAYTYSTKNVHINNPDFVLFQHFIPHAETDNVEVELEGSGDEGEDDTQKTTLDGKDPFFHLYRLTRKNG